MSESALGRGELVVRTIAQTAVDNETYFCELDAVVGDGDFGYSLARGFEIVVSDWDSMEYSDIGGLLKKTAIILSKRIGGTSGPIWGTAFLRAGGALSTVPEPSGEQIIGALREATKGMVAQRGRGAYTGERSRDSADAGAVGVAVILEAVSRAWQQAELKLA
jgi:dihydroxyacetone kinase-like protein